MHTYIESKASVGACLELDDASSERSAVSYAQFASPLNLRDWSTIPKMTKSNNTWATGVFKACLAARNSMATMHTATDVIPADLLEVNTTDHCCVLWITCCKLPTHMQARQHSAVHAVSSHQAAISQYIGQ